MAAAAVAAAGDCTSVVTGTAFLASFLVSTLLEVFSVVVAAAFVAVPLPAATAGEALSGVALSATTSAAGLSATAVPASLAFDFKPSFRGDTATDTRTSLEPWILGLRPTLGLLCRACIAANNRGRTKQSCCAGQITVNAVCVQSGFHSGVSNACTRACALLQPP